MIRAILFLSLLGAAGATTAPTTAPATAPSLDTSLANGIVRFSAPPDWEVVKKSADGLMISYMSPDKTASITVAVSPQESAVTDDFRQDMALKIGKGIREQFKKDGRELLLGPKIEKDDRFYLKIHDRSRGKGHVVDRIQVYRTMGLELMFVAAVAQTDSEEDAAAIHKMGESLLLGAKLSKPGAKPAAPTSGGTIVKKPAANAGKPGKPSSFPKAKIKLMPPMLWSEEKNDDVAGMVATYHDTENDASVIAVSVQLLPKETKKDPKARQIALDDLIDHASESLHVEGGKLIGKPETIEEPGFLKKTKSQYEVKGGMKFQVDSRLVLVGDAVVTVTSLAAAPDAEGVRQVADKLALSITPIGAR